MAKQTNILIGATGSVASIKIPELVQLLTECPHVNVKVVTTNAGHFFFKDKLSAELHTDKDEWDMWKKKTDPVLHIELRNWADMMVIAPLDANTLAKIANGLCDNLLTCILRAWDTQRPVIVCPAMNTNMWDHPFTQKHLDVLRDTLHFEVIDPIAKLLACGDIGMGAMEEPQVIVQKILARLNCCKTDISKQREND